ncbi:hypothetical protein DRH27_05480 [Candidatus Falkowbacteria bacterium]|nr:MAG: hypothetical protein DRH27_05480 [Candidatus Falkowbacteria bacterium]
MTIETATDRSGYLATFGEVVTIGGGTCTAIFDYEYVEVNEVESKQPALTVLSTDATDAGHGDAVTVRGVGYTIISIQADGTGLVLLVLAKS